MHGFSDFFESVFDKHAPYWLKKTGVPQSLQQELDPLSGKGLKVLDLGCGGGRLAKSILPSFGSVSGIDNSADLLDRAKKENPEINYACGNFQSPQVWQNLGMFDVIVSNCAIRKDYCGNLSAVVENCYNHLNENGMVILRIQAFEDLNTVLPADLRKEVFYNENELKSILSQFSFVDVKHETY